MALRGGPQDPSSLIRKWYFCVNEAGFAGCFPLVVAAVASAMAETRLQPICLYDGTRDDQAALLGGTGATVIRHRSSLHEALRQGYGADYPRFSGHWLRVDLPLIDSTDDLVLYTDVDVLFLAPPRIDRIPRTLSAGPEFDLSDRRYFSSGVMVLNLAGMRATHAAFCAAIRDRLARDFRYPAHDQQSYNDFFRRGWWPSTRRRGRLAAENNWKPFWGWNPQATILHFHGPKPWDVSAFQQGALDAADPHRAMLANLWRRDPEAYARALRLWQQHHAEGMARLPARGQTGAPEA